MSHRSKHLLVLFPFTSQHFSTRATFESYALVYDLFQPMCFPKLSSHREIFSGDVLAHVSPIPPTIHKSLVARLCARPGWCEFFDSDRALTPRSTQHRDPSRNFTGRQEQQPRHGKYSRNTFHFWTLVPFRVDLVARTDLS